MTEADRCNLIVNYIPQTLSDQEFRDLFELIGPTTSTRIIRDKHTNYSFGYGFVNYTKPEDAAKAIEQLNGQSVQHKNLKVAYSQPSGAQTKNINLHVSGLPPYASEETLREQFQHFGMIVQCRVVTDKNTGQCQGFGFILYAKREEALAAIKAMNGALYKGSEDNVLNVKFAKTEQKGPPSTFLRKTGQVNYAYNNGSYGMGTSRGGGLGPLRGHAFMGRYSPMMSRGGYGNCYSGGGDSKFQTPTKETIVFVYGIGPDTDENKLWQMFSAFGNIVRVNVIWDHVKGVGKGYGFVTYRSVHEATLAIQSMNGFFYQGRSLQVSIKADGSLF